MREIEQITDFSKGIVTSVDAIDIPSEACVLATNIEPNEGYLVPVKEPTTITATSGKGLAIKDFGIAVKTSATKSIVCQDGNNIKYGETSVTFANTLTTLEAATGTDFLSYNREVRIAKQVIDTKIFKHSDFWWFGLKNTDISISKCNTNVTDDGAFFDKMIYFRGQPSVSMTVYIPVFTIDSISSTSVFLTLGSLGVETTSLLTAIKDSAATPKKLVIISATRVLETLEIADIDVTDPYNPVIITIGASTTGSPRSCFIYAGSTFDGNPAVVTNIGSTFTAYMTGHYNRDIGNGIYLWSRGGYEDVGSVPTLNASRILNAYCVITPKDYLYEDANLSTIDA